MNTSWMNLPTVPCRSPIGRPEANRQSEIENRQLSGLWAARLAWACILVLTAADTSGQSLEQRQPRLSSGGELRIRSVSPTGELSVTGTFTNGVCTLLTANELAGPWVETS